eukprot:gene6714-35340_t
MLLMMAAFPIKFSNNAGLATNGTIRRAFKLNLNREGTILAVKTEVAKREDVAVDVAHMKLVFNGKTLKDTDTLHSAGVLRNNLIQVIKKQAIWCADQPSEFVGGPKAPKAVAPAAAAAAEPEPEPEPAAEAAPDAAM